MTIKKVRSFSIYKRLLTGVAALAFALQPFAGVVHAVASTVNPSSLNGWVFVDDNGHGGSGSFVSGPAGSLNAGSVQLSVSAANQGYMLYKAAYGGTKLADISTLSYQTYVQQGNNTIAPALQLDVDRDVTDGDTTWSGRLIYEPYQNAAVTDGSWQTWDTTGAGKWWFSNASKFDNTCGQSSPCTFDNIVTAFPNIGVRNVAGGGVGFKAGSGWNVPFTGNVDNFTFNSDTYDFEPTPPPATPTNLAFSNPPVCDGYTKTMNTTASWSSVPTATSYNYRAWKPGDPIYNSEATAYTTVTSDASQLGSFNLGEGTYYFQVQAVNAANETSDWSASCAANYDITKPTIAVNTVNGSLNPATVSVTGTDNTQLQQVTGHIYNATNTALIKNCSSNVSAANTSTYTLTCNIAGLADGTYTIRAISSDKAGNLSATNSSVKFDIDHTAPMGLAHLSPADGSFTTTANAASIDWTDATDPHGPVSYFYESSTSNATNPDGSFTSPVYQSGALSSSTIPTPNTPAGVYYWHVRAVDAAGSSTSWTTAWKITVDNTKPTIVVNTANNAVNPATVSVTGTDNTELKQVTGHIYNESNSTLIKNCSTNVSSLNVSTYTVSCNTNTLADGTYTIRANALDKAGNLSTTLSSTKFVIDHTAPNISLTSPTNSATVPGTSLTQHWASTSTDVDHYVYESFNNAAATSLRWSENMGTHTSKTANNVANATFWWRVTAYDHAGNATVSPLWKLTVSNPVPSVSAQDFSTWDNSANGFMGITAGFGLNDFSHVNSITVTLANADGDIVTNTADPDFISLINANDWTQFSSPFVVSGTLDDTFCNGGPCWIAGAHTWTATDKPTKVTATVVGKNNLGQTVTKTATNTTLAESPNYESLLPPAPVDTTNVLGDSTSTPGMGGSLPIATFAAVVNPDSAVELVSDDATNTDDSTTDQTPAKTLGAATNAPSDNNSDSDTATTATGLAWYWWAIIIAAVAGAAWWLFAARRRSSES